ncbi:MAG TPA: hypothetical protein VGF97_00960 [Rhizomicrobium sp.]|jgi:hypothetical protein
MMSANVLQILGICAGFAMILAATVLAFRQSLAWQHVIVFCLGGVLTGISGIQFQSKDVSVTIGQLAQAAVQTNTASTQQADAIASLNTRVDQLQQAIAAVAKAGSSAQTQAAQPVLSSPNTQHVAIEQLLSQSRVLSRSALTTTREVASAPSGH